MNTKSDYRYYFFTIFFLSIVSLLKSQTAVSVWQLNGTMTSVAFSETNKLTFSDNKLLLHKTDGSMSAFASTDFRKITFGVLSGLEPNNATKRPVAYIAAGSEWLHVLNLQVYNAPYSIYTTDGSLVLQGSVHPSSRINIQSLSKGIYILRIANNTLKFITL